MAHLLGYARVSTGEQHPDLQVDALKAAGCYRVFVDTASGALAGRPALDQVLDQLRPGDTLVVWKLGSAGPFAAGAGRHHHLGRQAGVPHLRRAGRVRARPGPGADQRWAGRRPGPWPHGRPAGGDAESKIRLARQMYASRQYTVAAIASALGVSRASIYRHLDGLDG